MSIGLFSRAFIDVDFVFSGGSVACAADKMPLAVVDWGDGLDVIGVIADAADPETGFAGILEGDSPISDFIIAAGVFGADQTLAVPEFAAAAGLVICRLNPEGNAEIVYNKRGSDGRLADAVKLGGKATMPRREIGFV
jgi:hypothetical protein